MVNIPANFNPTKSLTEMRFLKLFISTIILYVLSVSSFLIYYADEPVGIEETSIITFLLSIFCIIAFFIILKISKSLLFFILAFPAIYLSAIICVFCIKSVIVMYPYQFGSESHQKEFFTCFELDDGVCVRCVYNSKILSDNICKEKGRIYPFLDDKYSREFRSFLRQSD